MIGKSSLRRTSSAATERGVLLWLPSSRCSRAACPAWADDQRYEPSWRRESVSAGDGSGAATRRLRRLCTTGTEMASNAAP